MVFRNRQISIMVLFAISLHLWWAITLAIDSSALSVNAIDALYRYIHPLPILIAVITGAATMALIGIFTELPWVLLFLIPQQVLLMMSAAGAIESMWLGQFADGVLRPHAFIAADQFYSVLAALGHTIAIIVHARRVTQ
ncbi:MAG: hypothetical protein JWP25_8976 [Bradyrhizobium sp.]|nr:hypothetical protein [Bradyrhizobium sp.]